MSVLLGYDNGCFVKHTILTVQKDSRPRSLLIDDFNNDSYMDIAVANWAADNIGILF